MDKESDKVETQSNFSLKFNERDLGNFKDDCQSMKSLTLMGEQTMKEEMDKEKDQDSISSKSFK